MTIAPLPESFLKFRQKLFAEPPLTSIFMMGTTPSCLKNSPLLITMKCLQIALSLSSMIGIIRLFHVAPQLLFKN